MMIPLHGLFGSVFVK